MLQVPPLFQIHAALHQNTALRCERQCRHNRHRRRNHDGAGAGNHENYQTAVNPRHPITGHKRPDNHHRQRQTEYGRGVARSKFIHEALQRRFFLFCGFHRPNDSRTHRITRRSSRPNHKRTFKRQSSGPHLAALGLLHRKRFTRNHGFIHGARTFENHAVKRGAFPGFHAVNGTGRHGRNGYLHPSVVHERFHFGRCNV